MQESVPGSIPVPSTEANIYQRMIAVQKAVKSVEKNETVKMSDRDKGYKAVTHDDVAAALHMPLAEAGIFMLPTVKDYEKSEFEVEKKNDRGSYIQRWYRTDLTISVKWINVDRPEDFIETEGHSFALDTSDKSYAKAYSLALKIILLKVHLLESRDGEEERAFEKDGPSKIKPNPKIQPLKNDKPAQAANQDEPPVTQAEPLDEALLAEEAKQHDLMHYLFELVEIRQVPKTHMPELIKLVVGRVAKSDQLTVTELESVISHIKENFNG